MWSGIWSHHVWQVKILQIIKYSSGGFLYLSSSNTEKGTDYPHHSSRFNIDEDVLWEGVAGFNSIAKQILQN